MNSQLNWQQMDPNDWCKTEATDNVSFIIVLGISLLQLIMLMIFLFSLSIRRKRNIQISSYEEFLFKIIAIWFALAFLQSIINIFVYLFYVTDETKKNDTIEVVMSVSYLFFNRMGSFSLHTLLIKIPCIWIYNTIIKLQDKELTFREKKKLNRVFSILQILQVYSKVRVIIILVNFAYAVYFTINPNFGKMSNLLTIFTIFQCSLAIFVYTFGMISLNKFKGFFNLSRDIARRIKIQYASLMLCCVARLAFDYLFYFHVWKTEYVQNPNCQVQNSNLQYIYKSLGYFFMHILPIFIIIVVYWPTVVSEVEESSITFQQSCNERSNKPNFKSCYNLLGSKVANI